MRLRFQTSQPRATYEALWNLNNDAWGLLGLKSPRTQEDNRFTFPTIRSMTIWLDIEIDHYYYAAWLLWAEHARACGLISGMEIVPEQGGTTP